MTRLNPDAVARRLLKLTECVAELRSSAARDPAELARNAQLRAATERWLQVGVEACVDIAYQVVAANRWTPPSSARGAFSALAGHGILDPALAERLGHAAGLRNVLVHDYVEVDLAILARFVREDLDDLDGFGRALASQIGS